MLRVSQLGSDREQQSLDLAAQERCWYLWLGSPHTFWAPPVPKPFRTEQLGQHSSHWQDAAWMHMDILKHIVPFLSTGINYLNATCFQSECT